MRNLNCSRSNYTDVLKVNRIGAKEVSKALRSIVRSLKLPKHAKVEPMKMVRQYLPKGTLFEAISDKTINDIQNLIDNRPRCVISQVTSALMLVHSSE